MKQYNTNVSREEVAALLSYDPHTVEEAASAYNAAKAIHHAIE